jgi:hypothetical protein
VTPIVTDNHADLDFEGEAGQAVSAEELCLLLAAPYYRCPAEDDSCAGS